MCQTIGGRRVWQSDHPPVEVGGATLDAMVRAIAARVPHRPALSTARAAAASPTPSSSAAPTAWPALLAERGFGPGDVLALWLPNLPRWAGVALGAMAPASR